MIWFLYVPVAILTYIFCLITNPIVILFCDENGELDGFLRLWKTWDDSCDSMFFMDNVCPKFLDYDYHTYYEHSIRINEDNREVHVSTFKGLPFSITKRIQRYFCRLWWLTRNCAYGFAYEWLSKDLVGTDGHYLYQDEYSRVYWEPKTKTWMVCSDQPIIKGYFRWEVFLGWKVNVDCDKMAKYMLAMRLTFRFE